MATHSLLSALQSSSDIFIHNFDVAGDRALLLRLTEEQRRKASFLDDRILGVGVEGAWAPWADVERAAAAAPAAKAHFIFHVGHCGSTLISRLIEEVSRVRSLREPAALRTLATIAEDAADGLALWSEAEWRKRFALYLNVASKGEPTVVKTTSWCGGLVDRTSGAAVFCYLKPEIYVATMLGGANNPTDLKLHAPIRLRRLRRLCAAPVADLSALSPGELAAMSWAAECATMATRMTIGPASSGRYAATSPASGGGKSAPRVASSPVYGGGVSGEAADGGGVAASLARERAAPERPHGVDFDAFLARPEESLAAILAHLSLPSDPERIRTALAGPLMRTYSKDAAFDYSPADRRMFLAEYAAAHAAEIVRGRAWLNAAAKAHAPIAAAIARFGA